VLVVKQDNAGEVIAHYAVGIIAPLLAVALFLSAHGLVDAEKPDPNGARTDYIIVIAVSVLTLGGAAVLAARNGWWALTGVAAGVGAAFWLRDLGTKIGGYWCGTPDSSHPVFSGTYTSYPCDPHADIAGTVTMTTLLIVVGALGAAGLLAAIKQARYGHATVLATGLALTTGFGLASAMLLPGLDDRAAAAAILNRPVHHTPGLELVAAVAALAGLALWARRRS